MDLIMKKNNLVDKLEAFFKNENAKLKLYIKKTVYYISNSEIEDLVSSIYLGILEKINLNVEIENLSSYIYATTKNKIIDNFRTAKKTVSFDEKNSNELELKDLIADLRINLEDEIEKKELLKHLYLAIGDLSENEKSIIIEQEFNNKSFKDLSKKWNIPIGTLLSRKANALNKIKLYFKKNYGGKL
ncbi:MAG: hypothetical protein A2086_14235 [Spirochaetes bacterium GWD1_27_9]|nr:MAG: hypothetical protein A2Z98_09285 [Spirochaetes bacterium GWB1_27_13]OHD23674.1 MAG: hypothetical protein A2Y34_15425 [Spirochaetes bacterium GWC1_27_15]OHD29883.1 MAG: hypothetical protein A2086_14235 [Spirochaetes bacterium GWD1_27_9]